MEIHVVQGGARQAISCGNITKKMACRHFELSSREDDGLMEVYLVLGADPNANNNEAMKAAVASGNLDRVKMLYKYKASLNVELSEAIRKGYIDVARFMFEKGAKLEQGYLQCAIESKSCEMVDLIMKQGDVEVTETDVYRAIETSALVAKKLLSYKGGGFLWKRLKKEVEQADFNTVKLLMDFLRDNKEIERQTLNVDYEQIVNNAQNTRALNDILRLIMNCGFVHPSAREETFYKKASMETLELLGFLDRESSEKVLQNTLKVGNKELAIQVLSQLDVDTTKIRLY